MNKIVKTIMIITCITIIISLFLPYMVATEYWKDYLLEKPEEMYFNDDVDYTYSQAVSVSVFECFKIYCSVLQGIDDSINEIDDFAEELNNFIEEDDEYHYDYDEESEDFNETYENTKDKLKSKKTDIIWFMVSSIAIIFFTLFILRNIFLNKKSKIIKNLIILSIFLAILAIQSKIGLFTSSYFGGYSYNFGIAYYIHIISIFVIIICCIIQTIIEKQNKKLIKAKEN